MLENYFMMPQKLGTLDLYPIKLLDYEEFRGLANEILAYDVLQHNNARKQEKKPCLEYDHLFDYIVAQCRTPRNDELLKMIEIVRSMPEEELAREMAGNEELKQMVENIDALERIASASYKDKVVRLMGMVTKKEVRFVDGTYVCFAVYEGDRIAGVVNKENFYEFRKIVMTQNLVHEPIVMKDERSQRFLNNKLNANKSEEMDFEALLVYVSIHTGLDYSDCTYYRLKADFEMLMRDSNKSDITLYSANGATNNGKSLKIPNIFKELKVGENPYNTLFEETVKKDY